MARIGIIGSEGRMGHALARAIADAGHDLAGGVDQGGNTANLAEASDVLVDFTAPAALEGNLHAAVGAGIPILVGTTGLEERHHAALDSAAFAIPVLQTGNTSLGVTLLAHLVQEAAARLGDDWDIEIVETHHRMKVDAPSGTALLLGEAAAKGRGIALSDNMESGRHGMTGARAQGAIGFATLRGGRDAGRDALRAASRASAASFARLQMPLASAGCSSSHAPSSSLSERSKRSAHQWPKDLGPKHADRSLG